MCEGNKKKEKTGILLGHVLVIKENTATSYQFTFLDALHPESEGFKVLLKPWFFFLN